MATAVSTYDLFIQALDVTNAALEANQHSLILWPMLSACERELQNEDLAVEIYNDDPEQPVDFFTIRMDGHTFVLVAHTKNRPAKPAWKVSVDYLRDVVDHPRRYINNPALLAFDWLKQRIGLVA